MPAANEMCFEMKGTQEHGTAWKSGFYWNFYHVETCIWARNVVKSFLVLTLESKLAEYKNYLSLYFCWSTPFRFQNQFLQESENVRGLKNM